MGKLEEVQEILATMHPISPDHMNEIHARFMGFNDYPAPSVRYVVTNPTNGTRQAVRVFLFRGRWAVVVADVEGEYTETIDEVTGETSKTFPEYYPERIVTIPIRGTVNVAFEQARDFAQRLVDKWRLGIEQQLPELDDYDGVLMPDGDDSYDGTDLSDADLDVLASAEDVLTDA